MPNMSRKTNVGRMQLSSHFSLGVDREWGAHGVSPGQLTVTCLAAGDSSLLAAVTEAGEDSLADSRFGVTS